MFDLNKCTVAIAASMVGTIRSGDDANRFSHRANAEGFTSISQLIAADAVKQAVAIQAELQRVAAPCATEKKLGEAVALHQVTTTAQVGTETVTTTLTDFDAGKGPEVFANPATATASITPAEVLPQGTPVPPVAAPACNAAVTATDSPALPVAAPVNTTSTSTTSAIATSAVELDSEGLPWDGRIHSSSKQKIVKGNTWKLKRGLDQAVVDSVKTELRAAMAIPPVSPVAEVASVEVSPTAPSPIAVAPAPAPETDALHPNGNPFSTSTVNSLVAAGNGATTVAASTPQATVGSIETFAQLMPAITKSGLDMAYVNTVVQTLGLPSMAVASTRPDLIPKIAEALGLA